MGLERTFNQQTDAQRGQEEHLTELGRQNATTPTDMMRQIENSRTESERIRAASADLTQKGILPSLQMHGSGDKAMSHDIAMGGISHRISESLSLARAETNPALVRHR